ncbi:MAG: hypothetical protein JST59_12220 [Actinobacteria bacterium]|nr:hypothetical protein [Actinomycetota bacterium]
MDTSLLWRSALVQLVSVGILFAILALTLPHSFFDDWGWLTGPIAWMLCAALTARVLSLPLGATLLGAVLAGIPDAICVLIGLHALGGVIAIVLFAFWCARLPRQRALTA